MERVTGVLSELGDDMEPERLVEASASASILRAQRLGYFLEYVRDWRYGYASQEASAAQRARNFSKLRPGMSAEGALRSKDYRLFVNARDYVTQCREQTLSRSVGEVAS